MVALIRARFGGNEVLISLMTNYVAILIVQYLVSGPMRAPGGVPETALLPRATWLPFSCTGHARTPVSCSPYWQLCWCGCCCARRLWAMS